MSQQRRVAEHSVRFWGHIDPGPLDECWEWQGRRDVNGYGVLSIGQRGAVELWKAHRLSWELHRGPIPDGFVIRHQCGNRCCVNPRHLLPGSQFENIGDTMRMSRVPCGEEHWNGKLTKAAVKAIRVDYAAGATRKSLAEVHGVGEAALQSVLSGNGWRHVTSGDGLQPAIDAISHDRTIHRGSNNGGSKLNEAKVVEIRQRYASGEHQSALAAEYGVSGPLVSAIVNGRVWRHVQDGLQPDIDGRLRPPRLGSGQRPGSGHSLAKLDEEKVVEIRRRVAAGERQIDLAAEFGVSRPTLSSIVARTTWKHVEHVE